jgi:MFS family permease
MAALHYRDLQLLIVGKVLGWIPLYMVLTAIGYQVYDITGKVENLAYIGLATFAPAIGLSLITGYVADLFDRRLVVGTCYAIVSFSAILFLMWSLGDHAEVWPVFVILLVLGTGRAFYHPAANSLLPNLVPPEIFPNAVAWHTSTNKIAQTVGPMLGGLVYLAGPEYVYAISAGGLAIGTITSFFIKTKTSRAGKEPTSWRVLFAGLRYVYDKKIILGAITLDLFVVLLGGVTALLPVFAKDILDVGPAGAGLLRGAIAAGSLATGIALTRISMTRAVGSTLYISIFVFGGATILFGISTVLWLSLVAMVILGIGDMVSVYIRVTLIQIATPDDMRGRVSAVNSVFTGASNEIGEFRAGMMAAAIGTVPAVLFGGIGCFVVVAICWFAFPELRRVQRMDREL